MPLENSDVRGNRRYFSIASSPKEENLSIAVRLYNPSSTFKKKLKNMKTGEEIYASELGGDFTLPKNKSKKIAFIAGGIGIVPFRSMIKHLEITGEKRNVVLFYSNKTIEDIAYVDDFERAKNIGLKTIYAVNNAPDEFPGHRGRIDVNLIKQKAPDFMERTFYISGPPGMVNTFKKTLKEIGVGKRNIRSDYFEGY